MVIVTDADSVVDAGSAGTTVTGSASGDCDMVSGCYRTNERKSVGGGGNSSPEAKMKGGKHRWDIQQAHILSAGPQSCIIEIRA